MNDTAPTLAQFGLGPIGAACVEQAVARGLEVIGGVDVDPGKVGRSLGELTGAGSTGAVHDSIDALIESAGRAPDVVIHTAGSDLADTLTQITALVERGIGVVSTCEPMLFPWLMAPKPSVAMDELCRSRGVAVVGTGVNPGFVMDLLPVVLTQACSDVRRIEATRVVDASTRRRPLQLKVGSGQDPAAYEAKLQRGEAGHAGFAESAALIADAMGWVIDELEAGGEAVVADRRIQTEHVTVEPGQTRGLRQVVTVRSGGREVIELDLTMALGEQSPGDRIVIDADPAVDVQFNGGLAGDGATVAAAVNTAAHLMGAAPGLRKMIELPLGWRG